MEEMKLFYDSFGLQFQDGHLREITSVTVDTALAKQHKSFTTNLRNDDSWVVFLCEGNERVVAVRALLCAGCTVIRNMLMGGMRESRAKEISLPEVSAVALSNIINFVCYGKFDVHQRRTTNNKWMEGLQTIKAANFLLLEELETLLWHMLLCDLYNMLLDSYYDKNFRFDKKRTVLSVINAFTSTYEISDRMYNTLHAISSLLRSSVRKQWLETGELRFLSKEAMLSWLEIKRGGDEIVTGEVRIDVYLRLRQLLLWCVPNCRLFGYSNTKKYQREAENVIDSFFPSGTNVVRFVQSYIDGVPVELDSFLESHKKVDVSVLREACSEMNFEKDFFHSLDIHLLHPVILMKIVEPLKIFS
ncbi:hypothetical protein R1flu_028882 [Riccia fluitans]|uniref:BTB domain-containing protein n=1 Tax=Riccia fluitans TaxID=41844 RepID=A0ABD1XMZ3_9MARC